MVKEILVESCLVKICPYSIMENSLAYCNYYQEHHRRGLHDYPNIPDWCPLDDHDWYLIDGSRDISDDQAKKEIKNLIKKMKHDGVKRFSELDIMSELNIPTEQIEKILEELRIR